VVTNELGGNGITIFPNPTRGNFKVVAAADGLRSAELSVFDAAGKLLENQSASNLPGFASATFYVDALPAGVYVVAVDFGTGREVARVVVE